MLRSHFTLYFQVCAVLILILSWINSLSAQTRRMDSLSQLVNGNGADSLRIKALGKLSWEYTKLGQFEDARKQSKRAIAIVDQALHGINGALKNRLLFLKGLSCNDLGINAYYEGNYTEALNSYLDALKLFASIEDKKHMAIAHGNIGLIDKNLGNYPQAIKEYLAEQSIAADTGDKLCQSDAYSFCGEVYRLQGSLTEALKSQNAALELRKELGDKNDLATSYACIALIYSDMHKYKEALKFDSLTLELYAQTHETFKLSTVYMNMASCFDDLKNEKKAMELYNASLKLKEAQGDQRGVAECYLNMGYLMIKNKEPELARPYIEQSMKIALSIGYKDDLRECNYDMAVIDSLKGNYKSGWQHYMSYVTYRDSLFNEEATRKTTQAQMQYDFDRKESVSRALQEKKDALEQEEKNKQAILRNSFIGGFLLTSLLGIAIYTGYRRKRKDNALLANQNQVIAHQKELVEEKQKEIIDSITYAKRLQEAILPTRQSLQTYLPGSFVLYLPKDIVAGDFYWMERTTDTIFVAAADCTGHGVPGAMVSVVCSNALNRSVKEFGITEPGRILDKAAELVKDTFSKSEADVRDGMDISLLALKNTGELSWAGAYNPLWMLHADRLSETGADKQPVGKTDAPRPFTTHKLNLHPGDYVYLFTDGFADQFGGPKGKKFKYKPLQELLLKNSRFSPEEQKKKLEECFHEWKGKLEQVDDICIIGIRVPG